MTTTDTLTEAANAMLAHVNANHDDSLLLLARILGDQSDASSARLVGVDTTGLDVVAQASDGEHSLRLQFASPVNSLEEISDAAIALVLHARGLSGEAGETSLEREARQMQSTRTFITSVSAVEQIHPNLRKITFSGGDLATFKPLGPDTFLYVLLPPAGSTELTIDQTFSWEAWNDMAEDQRPVGAYYTLRDWRPEAMELDMLFVLHEPAGSASAWAATAQPGDPVALWGPRESFDPPRDTDRLVLVADDTGLPAVAAIIERTSTNTAVHVIAEVDNPDQRQTLPERGNVEVCWVYRNGIAPGIDPGPLLAAVRAVDLSGDHVYVWGAGESKAMTAVRRYVRADSGLPRERVSLVAYWRHATTVDDDDS